LNPHDRLGSADFKSAVSASNSNRLNQLSNGNEMMCKKMCKFQIAFTDSPSDSKVPGKFFIKLVNIGQIHAIRICLEERLQQGLLDADLTLSFPLVFA
jgi:hypothetical protein